MHFPQLFLLGCFSGPLGVEPTTRLVFDSTEDYGGLTDDQEPAGGGGEQTQATYTINIAKSGLIDWPNGIGATGYVSKYMCVTVPDDMRSALLIPADATSFAWLYPIHDMNLLTHGEMLLLSPKGKYW